MQTAQVYELVKDMSKRPEKTDLSWEDSQFEDLKDEDPEQQNHLARNLLFKLLSDREYGVTKYESDLCNLHLGSDEPRLRFYAKVAVLDNYEKFKFKSIIPKGFTHLFLLGVEPNELRYKFVEARNLGNYNLTDSRSGYGIEINRDQMLLFDDFESEVKKILNNY